MSAQFSADFFKGNRERLRGLFTGTAPIVLTANGLLQRNSDATFPFRQDSSFWYLTGIYEPDVILVLDKTKEYLIVPERNESRAAFDGSIDGTELTELSGIETVVGMKIGWKQLSTRLKKVKHVATLAAAPDYVEQHGLYTNPARARLIQMIKDSNADIELLDLRPHLTRMRMVKQPLELEVMQRAIDITTDSLSKLVKKGLAKHQFEYEVDGQITGMFRSSGAQHAYTPIIAAGKNACTLHYVDNNAPLNEGDILLLDVGAEVHGYAADITRSYTLGEPSRRQQQVFEAVIAVQDFAIEQLKPGVMLREYEDAVQHYMGEKLRELGLIKTIEPEHVRRYYPHATSHFLGLDVHDVGEYDIPLEPDMVLTVEPGIYIPEEAIGIRIEDDVVITTDGNKVLSAALPRVLH